ncbi:MAG: DoxX family protein [Porticoccus sp.]|nr:DoxX family protein [Porticoccus sp.]
MNALTQGGCQLYQRVIGCLRCFEGVAPLLLRVFLAPIFILAGYGKLQLGAEDVGFLDRLMADPNVVAWFGNPDWGLGLPMPDLLAALAGWTEFLGGWLLLFGLLTRLISIPLMLTMVVAATTAHWSNGWHALPEAKLTVPWEWRTDLIEEGLDRKSRAVSILEEHGNYDYLTEAGSFTVLKNGIEFAATYFIMLFSLLFTGGGRFTSLDYWLCRLFRRSE